MKDSDIPKTSANDSITAPNCDSSYKSIIHFSKWRSESGWISKGAAYDIITDYTEIWFTKVRFLYKKRRKPFIKPV